LSSFNEIILLGHLTRDPQLSYTPNQTPVVDFGIATNRKWTGQEGQSREEVCFVDCRAFGKPAETLEKYLRKGHLVFLTGRLCFEQWEAQDGSRKSKHRVTIEKFQLLPNGNRQPAQNSDTDSDEGDYTPPKDDIPF